ncbi:ninja-family protein AFP3-like isoform X1 [Vigna umbellata]|uniref:ninja-family protein AFP3-like isoform X1 n=1 Tax=Vigna umbellata TaxID=87088 RepID=UPI001F5E6E12|nr:ninja-family protein AFP3-like isoform X1 [Vigna umbellata]XP_047178800.1 ninja-family protein AFP3-like isoform X1 [Vigna umbellata]
MEVKNKTENKENVDQRRCNEQAYTSKKIDLTLKLSPCGENENAEERKLTRSSSVEGEASGVQWDPYLGRSCSLPAEEQRSVTLPSPQVFAWVAASAVNVNTSSSLPPLKAHPIPSQASELQGLTDSVKGVALKIQTSTEEDNNSMASKKTMTKKISARHGETKLENQAKRHKVGNYCSLKGDVMEILDRMPSVRATGDGPDGKRIEGFLYKYRSGEVCIVCVCHGSFLTPAEFVKHAGAKEVANPMKHITVFSNSF